jgi:hypothetical protein
MGTERDMVYEGPCICGKGIFAVDYCNPDHGWPTSTPFWYESSIRCQDCNKLYELIEQEKAIVVVEHKEIARQKKVMEQWHQLRDEIMQRSDVKEILMSFVTLLRRLGTMAATHRLLKGANLDYYSLATFRKNWSGPEQWAARNLSPNNLKTVMGLLGITNDQVLKEVTKLDDLWEAANAPLQSLGKPVYLKK